MALKIHNTLTGLVEEMIPGGVRKERIEDYPPVTIYSCGPTVYSYAHIGNFRTFVFNDLLRRYLKFRGYRVNHAMNITDVDDKTINGSNSEGISLNDYTEKYTRIFFDDLRTLNIERVEHTPKATESVGAMIDILERLDKKGIAYEKEGSLYFSIGKFPQYGRLSRIDRRELASGLRYDTDEYDKEDVRDFALWKSAKEGEPFWDTPFGKGRPGWHIECSAMVRKIFGTTIDIHTGGVDLVFPHHENEIAQSEAAYDEPFVRYWIHAEHLLVDGNKMSKSLGNFYTLRDLLSKGFSSRSIRYLLMSAHYKKQLNFTFEGLKQADNALSRIDNLLVRLNEIRKEKEFNAEIKSMTDAFFSKFAGTVDNDLNISGGLGVFFDFLHDVNSLIDKDVITKRDAEQILNAIKKIDGVFGFIFFPSTIESGHTLPGLKMSGTLDSIESDIKNLIQERIEAKKQKNFIRADEIRNQLEKDGIILEDTKDGTRWKRKK